MEDMFTADATDAESPHRIRVTGLLLYRQETRNYVTCLKGVFCLYFVIFFRKFVIFFFLENFI